MAIRLGDEAPNFTAETTEGTINFHEWLGNSWGILFSHPKDFTPVCTTELGTVAKIMPELKRRGVKVIAISVDPLDSHHGWINDINETQRTTVNYPIIADPDKKVAMLYDMIHPNALDNMTVRSVFVIGPDGRIRYIQIVPEISSEPQYEPVPLAQQVIIIYAVTHGYLDDVPVDRCRAFELGLGAYVAAQRPDLVESLARGEAMTPETEQALQEAIAEFKAVGSY